MQAVKRDIFSTGGRRRYLEVLFGACFGPGGRRLALTGQGVFAGITPTTGQVHVYPINSTPAQVPPYCTQQAHQAPPLVSVAADT